jgi:catechol 2,3-dioxygenase-like lactoylglutathione lyase family enzyme
MLADYEVMGFVPTRDAAKAKTFYVDVLGLALISEDSFAVEVEANGTRIRITNAPEFSPLPFTILGWRVPDLSALVKELTDKGLIFERYGWVKQDALGIWAAPGGAQVAWFRDPDGNTLSLSQH